MKKLLLYPAAVCRQTIPTPAETRLLNVVGTFGKVPYWYPIQSGCLSAACLDEANFTFHRLRKSVLKSASFMRRFCGQYPEAREGGHWCHTYDFVCEGTINHYHLRCMLNYGDFNYVFVVHAKTPFSAKEAA